MFLTLNLSGETKRLAKVLTQYFIVTLTPCNLDLYNIISIMLFVFY